ncbi:hypothetical protein Q8A67_000602 [Cirrhinus molitorella]|uniref:Uncharacterized protein n=1 Tax=Cirrhinus molitorella TaxID=172907 RepID=A0AA88Q5M8_9TELE|nr:hypothetical protein Q8A67_000602 [Cirrhinus molitorella]
MTQTLSWMFLRDTWNKQTMIVNSRRSFCGEDVFCRIHLVTGEPLSKGTTYDLCRHKKMQQQTAYKKVTFMNNVVSLQAVQVQRTDLQASHRATWNITNCVAFHGTASPCLFRDQIWALTTTVDINITLAYLFLVWRSALMEDSVSALLGPVITL